MELETERRNLLNEKIKEVRKAEAKARQIVEQAYCWREEFFGELKKRKEDIFSQAKEDARREVEKYSKKLKEEIAEKISLLEKEEAKEEKELGGKVSQNFDRALEEVIKLFLETYGD